jgi:hypothetical protein
MSYTTTNYGLFVTIAQNREKQNAKILKIKESIEKIGWQGAILCKQLPNGKLEIHEGQHRFWTCQEMGLPIVYDLIQSSANTNLIIQCLNTCQTPWDKNDYIHFHKQNGISFYETLEDFIQKHPKVGINSCVHLLAGKEVSYSEIRKGANFAINPNTKEILSFLTGCQTKFHPKLVQSAVDFVRLLILHDTLPTRVVKYTVIQNHFKTLPPIEQRLGSTKEYLDLFDYYIRKYFRVSQVKKLNTTPKNNKI